MYLSLEEKLIVEGIGNYCNEKSMLNDNHIQVFNNILQSCTMFNMQSPLLIQTPQFIKPIINNSKYIQILFSGDNENGHWICIYYENNIIHIYDSLNSKTLDYKHKLFFNKLFPNQNNLNLVFETVQSQQNSYDCGVLAIAYAVSITFNICPCSVQFQYKKLRHHLLKIYNENNITMFPILNDVTINLANINICSNENRQFCSKFEILYTNICVEENTLEQNNVLNNYYNHSKKSIAMEIDNDELKNVDAQKNDLCVLDNACLINNAIKEKKKYKIKKNNIKTIYEEKNKNEIKKKVINKEFENKQKNNNVQKPKKETLRKKIYRLKKKKIIKKYYFE